MKKILLLFCSFSFILYFGFTPSAVYSISCDQATITANHAPDEWQQIEQVCSGKIAESKNTEATLTSQIQYMDTQIYLASAKIKDTEQQIDSTQNEIDILGSRITGLDTSLNYLSKLLIERIFEGYKQRNVSLLNLLLDSNSAGNLINKIQYYKATQDNNQKLLIQVEESKQNFEQQKQLREQKVQELDNLKITLAQQQADLQNQQNQKQKLLTETQNSETVYQRLLAQAQAEYAQIQGIIAGAGIETRIRDVSKGETIATIIPGPSCNSSGAHLHFTVEIGGSPVNPFTKLKPVDHTDDSGGDPWTPSGSWDWPVNPPIQFNQGYGITWFVNTYHWYPSHNGIDIDGTSYEVHAVADGTLYRGSYSGNGGCTLPYAKVVHKDSGISTLYLHVYVQ